MPYQLRRWEGVHNESVDRKAILCLKILLLVAVPTVLARSVVMCAYAYVDVCVARDLDAAAAAGGGRCPRCRPGEFACG